MIRHLLLLCMATALTACATAPTPTVSVPAATAGKDVYEIDPSHTFPHFEVSHFGFSTHRGRFNKTTGTITLDRAARTGTLDVTIDADSLDTGDPRLEQRLREPDWFDTATHPKITYQSNRLRFDGDKLVGVDGNLSIRGVTRPVTLTVTSFRCGIRKILVLQQDVCGVDAETRIKRSDFGVSAFPSMVGDDVKLLIQLEAIKR